MITQHQISCFLEVARFRSFTRAAQQLFLTQPAISKQVAALEEELGCALFRRAKHQPVQLTGEGELYFTFFERCVSEFQAVRQRAWELSGQAAGELRLGMLSGWSVAASGLPDMLDAFQRACPEGRVALQFLDMAALREAALRGEVDVAVTIEDSLPPSVPLERRRFARVRRVLLYSPEHPVARRSQRPAVRDFADSEFVIVSDQTFATDQLALSYLRPYGIRPRIRLVPSVEAAVSLSYSGRCVAIIDEWSRELENARFRDLPLDSCNHAVFAWNPAQVRPAVRRFLDGCPPGPGGQRAPDA